jgi:hypothetical protein
LTFLAIGNVLLRFAITDRRARPGFSRNSRRLTTLQAHHCRSRTGGLFALICGASVPAFALPAPAGQAVIKEATVVVKITQNDKNNLPGKLAEAELHFTEGVLDGLKLIGFTVWERRTGNGRNVTFPARSYTVGGERRSFALLRPTAGDAAAQERLRELILQAYAEHEEQAAVAS